MGHEVGPGQYDFDPATDYSYGTIRRGLERFWSLRLAASRSPQALIVYLDLWLALAALPSGMRERLWWLLIMDGQNQERNGFRAIPAITIDDLITGPIRRMRRWLNGRR